MKLLGNDRNAVLTAAPETLRAWLTGFPPEVFADDVNWFLLETAADLEQVEGEEGPLSAAPSGFDVAEVSPDRGFVMLCFGDEDVWLVPADLAPEGGNVMESVRMTAEWLNSLKTPREQ